MRKYDKILEPNEETKKILRGFGIVVNEDSICIDKSLLQRIIDFFKNLFKKKNK